MTRKIIELHNFDKYQPYFHAPLVDRIEGDSEELILSADGRDSSASNNKVSSMTMNVSGGIWKDFNGVVVNELAVTGVAIATNTTMFSFNTNTYKAAFVDLVCFSSGFAQADQFCVTSTGTVEGSPSLFTHNAKFGASTSGGVIHVTIRSAVGGTYKAHVKLL